MIRYELWKHKVAFLDEQNCYVGKLTYDVGLFKVKFRVWDKIEAEHIDEIAGMLPEIAKKIRMIERCV